MLSCQAGPPYWYPSAVSAGAYALPSHAKMREGAVLLPATDSLATMAMTNGHCALCETGARLEKKDGGIGQSHRRSSR
jgi:hypothetical protein